MMSGNKPSPQVGEALTRLHEAFAVQARGMTMDEHRTRLKHQEQVARDLDAAVAASGDPGVAALLRFVNQRLTSPDHAPTGAAIRALGRARATQAAPLLQSLLRSGTNKELKSAAGEALSLLQGGGNPWGLLKRAEEARDHERLRLLDQIDSPSFDRLDAQEKYYVWFLRGTVYKCRGDRERAIECFKTGLKYSDSPRNVAWQELKELQDPSSQAYRVPTERESKKLEAEIVKDDNAARRQEAITLHAQGLSLREVAERMGTTVSNIDHLIRGVARQEGHTEMVRILADADPAAGRHAARATADTTDLTRAIEARDLAVIKKLIDGGADVNALHKGRPAIIWAINVGRASALEIVEWLVQKGANVDAADDLGRTALDWAASDGKIEIVRLLLKSGASVHVVNGLEMTPLQGAQMQGHSGIVQLLRSYGGR